MVIVGRTRMFIRAFGRYRCCMSVPQSAVMILGSATLKNAGVNHPRRQREQPQQEHHKHGVALGLRSEDGLQGGHKFHEINIRVVQGEDLIYVKCNPC